MDSKDSITIENHIITDNFYVANVPDTNAVLGVKWLYYLWEHTVKYQVPEMRLKHSEGKPILLRGMHTYPNQVVSSQNMSILRYGDI